MKTTLRILAVLLTAGGLLGFDASGQSWMTNGLVAYYPFNGNANDAAGTNNGVVNGATLTTNRFGISNSAYYFNGTNNYIELASSTNVFGSKDYSISLWFNSLALPNFSIPSQAACCLISKGQNNFELLTGSSTSALGMHFLPRSASGNDWNTPASTYQTNVWQNVIAIYKPSTTNVYVFLNGSNLILSGPSLTPIGLDKTNSARLGFRTDGTLPFKGSISSVRIYNRALSTSEVSQLYATESMPPNLGITYFSNAPVVIHPTITGSGGTLMMATNLNSPSWVPVTNYVPFTGYQILSAPTNAFFKLQ